MVDSNIAPTSGEDRDRIVRIIRARCGDVLSDADLAALGEGTPDPDMLPATIGVQILDVISRMADRMDAFEKAVRAVA